MTLQQINISLQHFVATDRQTDTNKYQIGV